MIGFWIFMIVLTICATFVICTFLANANESFPLWETKSSLNYIKDKSLIIERELKKLAKENEHDRE